MNRLFNFARRGRASTLAILIPTRVYIMVIIFVLAMIIFFLPMSYLSLELSLAASLILIIVGMLATGIIAEQLSMLIFFFLTMVLSISPPSVVFSGFYSGAFWLVFGGLVIGAAVERTGLGRRIANSIVCNIKGNYGSVIATVILINVLLIFLMPSTLSRVVLLIPIMAALANSLGYSAGTTPYHGIIMAAVLSAYLCSTSVLPASVPNNVLVGAAESFQGIQIHYFDYLLLHFPVLGVLKSFVIWGCVVLLFKPKDHNAEIKMEIGTVRLDIATVYTKDERRLFFFLIVALVLWATDSIHGVAPAWISLGVGIICLMPVLGVVSSEAFKEKVQIGPLLFVAGILGVGAVVTDTGLGSFISELILEVSNLSPDDPLHGFFVLGGIAMLLGFFSTMPGVPAILVPIASDLSAASGLELRTVLMTQVIGFSTVWLPYQVPPIIIGMQLAGVPMVVGVKVTALIGLISLFTLMPLVAVWWQFLGYLPNGALW
jgi:di/tricarboxylate transporter